MAERSPEMLVDVTFLAVGSAEANELSKAIDMATEHRSPALLERALADPSPDVSRAASVLLAMRADEEGLVAGSLSYMPPEQATGNTDDVTNAAPEAIGRLVTQVGAGHHQRLEPMGHQQHVQGRVGQHDAEIPVSGGNRRGKTLAFLFFQQDDGAFGTCQQGRF